MPVRALMASSLSKVKMVRVKMRKMKTLRVARLRSLCLKSQITTPTPSRISHQLSVFALTRPSAGASWRSVSA